MQKLYFRQLIFFVTRLRRDLEETKEGRIDPLSMRSCWDGGIITFRTCESLATSEKVDQVLMEARLQVIVLFYCRYKYQFSFYFQKGSFEIAKLWIYWKSGKAPNLDQQVDERSLSVPESSGGQVGREDGSAPVKASNSDHESLNKRRANLNFTTSTASFFESRMTRFSNFEQNLFFADA